MPLSKLNFAPGIHKESTQYAAGQSWWDCDKVRFRKGRPEQVGGWQIYSVSVVFPVGEALGEETNSYRGVCRSIYDWGTAGSSKYLGIGTNLKFYIENGGALNDVTPIRLDVAGGGSVITFAATDGSSQITVTHTSHGAVRGDYVAFDTAASLGGNIIADVLNHEYEIDELITTDSYYITAMDVSQNEIFATASDTGDGGTNVGGEYQINTGTNSFVASVGYGVGTYGGVATGGSDLVGYGGGGSVGFSNQLRLYSQDAFGDDLIFNPRGGGIYYWDESVGVDIRAIDLSALGGATGSPVNALQVMVSPVDRHVIAFGVNALGSISPHIIDPLLVRWSDQENAAVWTPTATNSAGGQVLSSGTRIVGAIRTRQEILIFTDSGIHSMRFSGAPFIYQFAPISESISIVSPKAAISAGDAVFFMDMEGYYVYQGATRMILKSRGSTLWVKPMKTSPIM
jgi:hypothetical protein